MEAQALAFEATISVEESMLRRSSRRWWVCALLFASTFLNYLDRQVLSIVSPVLRPEFHLSAQAYSHLLTAFLVGYTIFQGIAGRIVDRLGSRAGLFWAMTWWSAAGVLAAFAGAPLYLGVCLFLMGVGEWRIAAQ